MSEYERVHVSVWEQEGGLDKGRDTDRGRDAKPNIVTAERKRKESRSVSAEAFSAFLCLAPGSYGCLQ